MQKRPASPPEGTALSPSQIRELGGSPSGAADGDGGTLASTSHEISEVKAQIEALRQQAAAVDSDTSREFDASHRVLHCRLLEEKQSELLDALANSPDDETLMFALKAVTSELAAATPSQGLTATPPSHTELRRTRSRADSERLASMALEAERDDAEEAEETAAVRPSAGRTLQRTTSSMLRPSGVPATETSLGLSEEEILLCAQAFAGDGGGGIDGVRRHCGLQLSGTHPTCGIPLDERLSFATDILNVAQFPPGSHRPEDAEWASGLLLGVLPTILNSLALTREQATFFDPADWSVVGVPRESDGSLRALLSPVHQLSCVWALLVM